LTPTQRYAASLARLFARLPAGLIEVHNKPDVAMWLARLFPGRPVSLHLHNDPQSMRGGRSPRARQRLLRRLASVTTVSEYVRGRLLEGVGPIAERVPAVIHNTLDPAQIGRGLPQEQREKVILFAGRVVPDKAPDLFIAACARALPLLPGWRAEMIGADGFDPAQPDSPYVASLRPLAAAAGIMLHGYKPHAEVLAAMERAAIVVVPSRWNEPFGMTALEAMACGAALISSARGGLAEVIGDAAIRIDPDDSTTVSGALIRLAGNAELRTRLAASGLARVGAKFATDQAVAALDRLRDDALSRGKRLVGSAEPAGGRNASFMVD
jgi:glycosyltransferase involved in cell wall biosynthesis